MNDAPWVRLEGGAWQPVEPPPILHKRHDMLRIVRDVRNASGRVILRAGDVVELVKGRRASPVPLGVLVPDVIGGKPAHRLVWLAESEVERCP